MRLGQTSVIYLISKILASVVGFLATIYFTRLLGEEIYGFYAITLALVAWLGVVKSIGFGQAVIKRMSESEEADAYLVAGTMIKASLTGIILLGIFLFDGQVNAYVGEPVAGFIALLLVASVFSGVVDTALQGSHRVHVYAPLSTGKEAGRAVVMVALVYAGWELTGMLVGHAIGTAALAMIGIVLVRPRLVKPRVGHFTSLFDFAKYSWLGNMRKKSFSSADILVLGLFVPAGLTGIYAVAYSLARFLDIFGSAIKTTMFPEMSKLAARDHSEMVAKLTNDSLTFAGLFLIPGAIGAAILGDRLMLIYGPGFDIGHWILVILLAALLVYTYTKQVLNTLNAIDRPDLAFRANGVFIVTNIALNIVLVYALGWFGAAIATVLSAGAGLVLSAYYLRQYVSFAWPFDEIARQSIAAIGMGVVVYVVRLLGEDHLIANYNEVFVLLLVTLGAILYFGMLLIISLRFRQTILENLPRVSSLAE